MPPIVPASRPNIFRLLIKKPIIDLEKNEQPVSHSEVYTISILAMKTIDNFRDLRELITSLETIEVKAARKFIDSFDSALNQRTNKSLKLYNLLVKYPNIDKDKAKNKVSRETDERSFEKLHTRLYEKIIDSLLLSININRHGLYAENQKAKFNLRKKLMQAAILTGRGLEVKGYYYIRKTIKRARQYELYDELLEGLYAKRAWLAQEREVEEFEQVDQEIKSVRATRAAINTAKDVYSRYLLDSSDPMAMDEFHGSLLETISSLKDASHQYQSDTLNYYLNTFLLEFYWAIGNNPMAAEVAAERAKQVEKSEVLVNSNVMGSSNTDLAISQLRIYDFPNALKSIRKALAKGEEVGPSRNERREVEIMTLMYLNKPKDAVKAANKLIEDTHPLIEAGLYNKRKYLKANALFMQNDYTGCDDILSGMKSFGKLNDHWLSGLRILGVINGIDHELPGKANNAMDGLRKHMASLRYKHLIRQRDQVIFRILETLALNGYDYKKTFKQHEIDFKLLGMSESQHRWNVLSHEVAIFQIWYQARMNDQAFEFSVPAELIKSHEGVTKKLDLV